MLSAVCRGSTDAVRSTLGGGVRSSWVQPGGEVGWQSCETAVVWCGVSVKKVRSCSPEAVALPARHVVSKWSCCHVHSGVEISHSPGLYLKNRKLVVQP